MAHGKGIHCNRVQPAFKQKLVIGLTAAADAVVVLLAAAT